MSTLNPATVHKSMIEQMNGAAVLNFLTLACRWHDWPALRRFAMAQTETSATLAESDEWLFLAEFAEGRIVVEFPHLRKHNKLIIPC